MLELQINRYKNGESHLSAYSLNTLLPQLKKTDEYAWLNDVAARSLQIECSFLEDDFKRFFKYKKGFPKFKSRKKSKPSYPCGEYFCFDGNNVKIQKIGKIKYKSDIVLPNGHEYKFSNISISCDRNKYYLSFGVEYENQVLPILSDIPMGIDLGVKELAVVAYGDKQFVFHNINKSKKMINFEKQIIHTQRAISRKYECSKKRTGKYKKTKNIEREEEKLRRLYARQRNIRKNYLHQTTHQLVQMLPCCVTMEDLNVVGMLKNKHLSKAIGEQNLSEFIRQMKYKCEWNGIPFIQVDRFYPSSKRCSGCGAIKTNLKLSDRTYVCPDCGLVIDRDYNAAINLMKYGTH